MVWFNFIVEELPDRFPHDVMIFIEDLTSSDVSHSGSLAGGRSVRDKLLFSLRMGLLVTARVQEWLVG